MARVKLLIRETINCESRECGDCQHVDMDYDYPFYHCQLFGCELFNGPRRSRRCLAAEKRAKGEK